MTSGRCMDVKYLQGIISHVHYENVLQRYEREAALHLNNKLRLNGNILVHKASTLRERILP